MRFNSMVLLFIVMSSLVSGQEQTAVLDLNQLVEEALRNNPDLQASLHQVDAVHARVNLAGALDDPELIYMREEMPGFRFNEAMYSRIELMQKFRFPSKLSGETEIAEINAEHSHHEHFEKELEVIARVKSAFYELWFAQHSIALNRENARLLEQFVHIAKIRFGTGDVPLQDVLKGNVELARLENQGILLQQQEQSASGMLIALLNRPTGDTLGLAVLPDTVAFGPGLDSLQRLALHSRPMLLHDSLAVEESRLMLSLSRQEYLPDITLALQYVTVPVGDFRGWSIRAGILFPFAPWVLGKANARVEEATAAISTSQAKLNASRNMVLSNVRDLYFKAHSARRQLDSYRSVILPQAQQSLKASMTAYQNGRTEFLMLVDAYRTVVELSMESLMVRMEFEQAAAALERQVGAPYAVSHSGMEGHVR